MRPGRARTRVRLYRKPTSASDTGPYDHPLDPPDAWVQIQPLDPSTADERRVISSRVTMRYHPQVTIDSHMLIGEPSDDDRRTLFVRGVQNVDNMNRELILFCEEVVP